MFEPMKRRTFLTGAALLPILAAGCQPRAAELTVHLLDRSIPLRLLKGFRQQQENKSLSFETVPTLVELYQELISWQQNPSASRSRADWVTLGDYWLSGAIQQKLIQPFSAGSWPIWQQLDPVWKQLVTRDASGQLANPGEVWGIPYRWGTLMMIYNPKYWQDLDWRPASWQDLLRSHPSDTASSPLARRVALPDHPRLVTGVALKLLGASANTADLAEVTDLTETLVSLHQQVRFYSSEHYLEPLLLEDISLAVGWSTDILPFLQQYRQFRGVIPTEGTLLTADLWVHPSTAPAMDQISPTAQAWVEYCLDPEVAAELAIFSQGESPRFWGEPSPAVVLDPALTLTPDLQQRSEFLLPVAGTSQFEQLWRQVQTMAAA